MYSESTYNDRNQRLLKERRQFRFTLKTQERTFMIRSGLCGTNKSEI